MKNERPDEWVSVSLRHRLGLMRGLRQNFIRPWLPRQIQFHSSGRRAGDWRPRDRPCGDCVPGRQARAAGRIEGAFCRGIVSFGNGPRRVFPDIVDYAKGGIFSRLRPSFDRRSGSALVPGKRRKQTWARCPPPSSRASCSAGPRSIPPAAICGLTRKSEDGDFSLGPILMAQINSRRRTKKRT